MFFKAFKEEHFEKDFWAKITECLDTLRLGKKGKKNLPLSTRQIVVFQKLEILIQLVHLSNLKAKIIFLSP